MTDIATYPAGRSAAFLATPTNRSLAAVTRDLHERMIHDILPLWSVVGVDHVHGGFAETVGEGGQVGACPRRIRVSARQVYVFSTAAQLGWNEAASRACVRHGYRFLCEQTSAEGFLFHSLDEQGRILDGGHELYDQAFLLLAYANTYRLLGDDDAVTRAKALQRGLRHRFGAKAGGYVDRLDATRPLRTNPHMHLLEAALAWIEIDDAPEWRALAAEIANLFQVHFFEPQTGSVLEDFNDSWRPVGENNRYKVEPGHNFEWAWLLMRWERLTGSSAGRAPDALIDVAEHYGVDRQRRVAVNGIWLDGAMADPAARLWPQTERIKAWLAVAARSTGQKAIASEEKAAEATDALLSYLEPANAGLWRDVMAVDGSMKAEPAPASSLYHIICALHELRVYHNDVRARDLSAVVFQSPSHRPATTDDTLHVT